MIARCLAGKPSIIIADEPVAGLDRRIRSELIKVLKDYQAENNNAYMIITHDLALVSELCNKYKVMYKGRIVESGTEYDTIRHNNHHPYTRKLIDSSVSYGKYRDDGSIAVNKMKYISDNNRQYGITDTGGTPMGCSYRKQCEQYCLAAKPKLCASEIPEMRKVDGPGQRCVACHLN